MQSRTKVRRRVLACARCRKRKLSCDGKVPSCTRCVDAGVACVGFDSSTQREAPRSIADFLEMHIASLEDPTSPTSLRRPGRPSAVFPSPAASHESEGHAGPWSPEKCTYADGLVNQAMEDITPSFLGISKARPILSCVVKGTQLPSKKGPVGGTDLDENHPRSIINPRPLPNALDAVDFKTASGLFHNFLDRVITQYPIYHRNDVSIAFNSIYYPASNPGHDSPRNRYIVSIIMAITLSTAARTNQKQANAMAYSLVRHALQWIPDVATNDLRGLQAILLLTQYIFLNPSMADVWLLTGLISQAVIDLGLHQELPNDLKITSFERDMRRRLFWCAWEMEVAVCSIFLRPVNLPIRNIDVAFPVEVDDTAITQAGIDPSGRISKFTSRRIWQFRMIEAEIISVLWHGDPIFKEYGSLELWMQKCAASMLAWHSELYAAANANMDSSFEARWKEMELYADIAYPYIMVVLNRPSRLIPNPAVENLVTAFTNAVQVADGYWQQSNADFGRIKYVFHPCHHVFNCALVFLQALPRCKAEISERYTYEQVEDCMGRFSRFFSTIAERWPAAARCLEEYERLLVPIKKEYADFVMQKSSYVPQQMAPPAEVVDGLYSYPTNFDEALTFWTTFNPTSTADAGDTLGAYAYSVPHDWNAEFSLNFGVEPMSEV
ncbi:fungal-specific transcription factor domain-containing protein [Massariosphaeria phaeospora]|uniref:Fungal-specific transcription factor domain-containing protein n=1 Tax=Massariosphaeria phaeospora TaxID=100035 RepID=A0A7C8IB57_9PLEO|nr:fungal-specific transcription factor domain-containing protein [Massariosphaeria phaeospora]